MSLLDELWIDIITRVSNARGTLFNISLVSRRFLKLALLSVTTMSIRYDVSDEILSRLPNIINYCAQGMTNTNLAISLTQLTKLSIRHVTSDVEIISLLPLARLIHLSVIRSPLIKDLSTTLQNLTLINNKSKISLIGYNHITSLRAENANVSDIPICLESLNTNSAVSMPIELMTNLHTLCITNHPIAIILPMRLTELRMIRCSADASHLTNLIRLDIFGKTNTRKIPSSVRNLRLEGHFNLSIRGLDLHTLSIVNSRILIEDIAAHTQLTNLYFRSSLGSSLGFSSFVMLRMLTIGNMCAKSYDSLTSLAHLRDLNIEYGCTMSGSQLAALTQITYLYVRSDCINKYAIRPLTNLKSLNIKKQEVMSNFTMLTNLRFLHISKKLNKPSAVKLPLSINIFTMCGFNVHLVQRDNMLVIRGKPTLPSERKCTEQENIQ